MAAPERILEMNNFEKIKSKMEIEKRYCTGHLDKKLKECKESGITYAQMQAEHYVAISREERA